MNHKHAVLLNTVIHHEVAERNRTNPGHGYLTHSETVLKFIPFNNLTELELWLKANTGKPYKVIRYQELEVRVETQYIIKEKP